MRKVRARFVRERVAPAKARVEFNDAHIARVFIDKNLHVEHAIRPGQRFADCLGQRLCFFVADGEPFADFARACLDAQPRHRAAGLALAVDENIDRELLSRRQSLDDHVAVVLGKLQVARVVDRGDADGGAARAGLGDQRHGPIARVVEDFLQRRLLGHRKIIFAQPGVRADFIAADVDGLRRGNPDRRADVFEGLNMLGIKPKLGVDRRDDQPNVLRLAQLEHLGDEVAAAEQRGVKSFFSSVETRRGRGEVGGINLAG